MDDFSLNNAIKDLIGKNIKICIRRLIRYELKAEKYENRIFCLDEQKINFISINKNSKPSKIEASFNLLEIKKLESLTKYQLLISTNDNRDFKFMTNDDEQSQNDIDDILNQIFRLIKITFPSFTIKDIIDCVQILPDKRFSQFESLFYDDLSTSSSTDSINSLKFDDILCDSYEKAYLLFCDYYSLTLFEEVAWDVNLIYSLHNYKQFSLNDFDYVPIKDSLPLLAALRYNTWFDTINIEGIKLTTEIQDEIARLLCSSTSKIKSIQLKNSSLKSDFTQKLLHTIQQNLKQSKLKSLNTICFKNLNLSRNSIEDKGAIALSNMLKELAQSNLIMSLSTSTAAFTSLNNLSLSKCSINSKGVNSLALALKDYVSSLNVLDLSANNLKDDPLELFKFLSEKNALTELNLANCDIDIEKLFNALSKGCEQNLKKLILSGNTNSSCKNCNYESLLHFFTNSQAINYVDFSSCKLNGQLVQILLLSLQTNTRLKDVHLNLSSNDLGSSLKSFLNDFAGRSCVTSLDLSDNNFEADFDIVLSELRYSSVKHLWLSKNFINIKLKHLKPIMNSLMKLVTYKYSKLESLYLTDCKLKGNLTDFINIIGACPSLKLLDISGNEVGDFGINLLCKSLQVNRSLQTLLFDRSNITTVALYNIIEALKRNFTLKTIQMPINDLCILYQRSPDKIMEISKQMNELILQRNNNNHLAKINIEQLFKVKMKVDQPSFQPKNSDNGQHSRDNSQIELKEILQNLNETAYEYITENPIEKQFGEYTENIIDKLDSFSNDLESKLNSKLKSKYSKYAINQILNNEANESVIKLNNLKMQIKSFMNSLYIQMHNEICEIAYQLTTSMAEKMLQNIANFEQQQLLQQQQQQQNEQSKVSTPLQTKSIFPQINVNEIHKFSFKNNNNNSNNNNQQTQSVISRFPFEANSTRSKRPVSTQIHETNGEDSVKQTPDHTNILNEDFLNIENKENESRHIYADIPNDYEIIDMKVEEKLNKNSPVKNTTNTQPANDIVIKVNDSEINKAIDDSDGNVNSQKRTPAPAPLPRKTKLSKTVSAEPVPISLSATLNNNNNVAEKPAITLEDDFEINLDGKKLEHLNKSRPKRGRTKLPTKGNVNIETVELNEELKPTEKEEIASPVTTPVLPAAAAAPPPVMTTSMNIESTSTADTNKQAKVISPLLKGNAEQPKISMDVLEKTKLRKTTTTTTTTKTPNETKDNESTTITTETNENSQFPFPAGLRTNKYRHSCYVPSTNSKSPQLPSQINAIVEDDSSTSDSTKPINKIPPLKPPKPLPPKPTDTKTTEQQPEQPPIAFVRLRPTNKTQQNGNGPTTTNDNSKTDRVNRQSMSVKERIQFLTDDSNA